MEGRETTLVESALETGGIDRAVVWDWARLAGLEMFRSHPRLMQACDHGLELWKPAIIEAQLREIAPGDMLLYHDPGKGFWGDHALRTSVRPLIDWALSCNDGVLPGVWVPELGRNRRWTTRACFRRMGCDAAEYWDSPQLQTTYSLWRHDRHSLDLIEAWRRACIEVYGRPGGEGGGAGADFHDFAADRGSQSVLTNLAVARGLRSFGEPHESTIAAHHPAAEPVPASDIDNLLARIAIEYAAPRARRNAPAPRKAAPRRALFTSIPPRLDRQSAHATPIGQAYQQRCIASWVACGFEIYSVHYAGEDVGDSRFDGVTRIEVARGDGDSPGEVKPTLEAILGVVSDVGAEISGIINADILLCEDPGWVAALDAEVPGSVVVFTRIETDGVDREVIGGPPWGYDLIFFDRGYVAGLTYCGMRMGECWWDYWLPLALVFEGARFKFARDPVCVHQTHLNGSFARFHVYGGRFYAWLMHAAEEQVAGGRPGEKRKFVEYCKYRFALGDHLPRDRQDAPYDFINEIFCITVWAWLCRLMRLGAVELIAKPGTHHRFVTDSLLRAIDHIEHDKVRRTFAGESGVAHDQVLIELERELTRFTPVWEERLARAAGPCAAAGAGAAPAAGAEPQLQRLEALIRNAGMIGVLWPVRVDMGARNLFRRLRGKPRFVPPNFSDPRAAIAWVRQVRRRPLTRYLARLDLVIWRLRRRPGRG